MNILLATATPMEMRAVLSGILPAEDAAALAMSLSVGNLATRQSTTPVAIRNHKLFLFVCGIGPVSAALHLGLILGTLNKAKVTLGAVLNMGIAGTYDVKAAPLGSVVQASCEIFPEFGLNENGTVIPNGLGFAQAYLPEGAVFDRIPPEPDMNGVDFSAKNTGQPASSPSTNKASAAPTQIFLENGLGNMGLNCHTACLRGPSVTVAGVSGDARRAGELAEQTGGLTENMEGFALALGAARCGLAFAELRAISNQVGYRPPQNWNLPGALAALTDTAKHIFAMP